MDKEQEFLDKLFEQPSSIRGLKNKYEWILSKLINIDFKHPKYELLRKEYKKVKLEILKYKIVNA